jgi:hypothetical protein
MSSRHFYRGYQFVELSTLVGNDKYRSRVAVVDGTDTATSSQQFLDFEVYPDRAAAQQRAFVGARAWIDARLAAERLERSSQLAPL